MKFSGVVGRGKGEGKKIGFPTANVLMGETDVSGIYEGTVTFEGKEYVAAVYADIKRRLIEAHLLDFTGDLYGKEITVTLGDKIREDRAFATMEELAAQIAQDVEEVRTRVRTKVRN